MSADDTIAAAKTQDLARPVGGFKLTQCLSGNIQRWPGCRKGAQGRTNSLPGCGCRVQNCGMANGSLSASQKWRHFITLAATARQRAAGALYVGGWAGEALAHICASTGPWHLHSRPMEFGSWKVHWNRTGAFALAEWPCCAAASLTAFRTGTRRPRETGERAVLMKVGCGEGGYCCSFIANVGQLSPIQYAAGAIEVLRRSTRRIVEVGTASRAKIKSARSHRCPPDVSVRHEGEGDKQSQWTFGGRHHP